MNENKLNLTEIDILIEESKKINFSSESEVRNLGEKYPANFKEVGSLNENSLIEYFKIKENYKQSKEIDPKTLLIKRKIYYTDLGNGKELKNLPGWKAIKDNNIYHKAHIIAKASGGQKTYLDKQTSKRYPNGWTIVK